MAVRGAPSGAPPELFSPTFCPAAVPYRHTVRQHTYVFEDMKTLLARASPLRAGDALAGVAAATYEERVAAQYALADVPLRNFLHEALVPYEQDEVTRLILDTHDAAAFAPVGHCTVGQLRDWLVSDAADAGALAALAPGLTPEMVAAVSKLLRNQELTAVARRMEVVTCFRNNAGAARTLGYPPVAQPMTPAASGMADAAGYF